MIRPSSVLKFLKSLLQDVMRFLVPPPPPDSLRCPEGFKGYFKLMFSLRFALSLNPFRVQGLAKALNWSLHRFEGLPQRVHGLPYGRDRCESGLQCFPPGSDEGPEPFI